MHGHVQCTRCGENLEPCCAGASSDDAGTMATNDGMTPAPTLFPRLFEQLGGVGATVTTDALVYALTNHLGCTRDDALLVLEAAERVGVVRTIAVGPHRLHGDVDRSRGAV